MLVRADLPVEVQIVQVGHACLEAGAAFGAAPGHHLVILAVPDRQVLLQAAGLLRLWEVPLVLFYEPNDDRRETALCTGAVSGRARRVFRHYPLWTLSGA